MSVARPRARRHLDDDGFMATEGAAKTEDEASRFVEGAREMAGHESATSCLAEVVRWLRPDTTP